MNGKIPKVDLNLGNKPTETVPTETVPTETVPTETVPTETVPTVPTTGKTLNNTDTKKAQEQVEDIEFWGENKFKLLSKASSKKEGWMKSTKAMEIPWLGCVVQVTTQQGDNIAEALTFVPGVKIKETLKDGEVVDRSLVVL